MEAKETVAFIQYYRHELLNHLQVIQGYMKLGNLEKAEANMEKLFEQLDRERDLLRLKIPHVFLWLFAKSMEHPELDITYSAQNYTGTLEAADKEMMEKLDYILQDVLSNVLSNSANGQLFNLHIDFHSVGEDCKVTVETNAKAEEIGNRRTHLQLGIERSMQENTRYSFNVRT
jgi:stage 0 sporulation protein B (sporulation initiation phosphotransferase)